MAERDEDVVTFLTPLPAPTGDYRVDMWLSEVRKYHFEDEMHSILREGPQNFFKRCLPDFFKLKNKEDPAPIKFRVFDRPQRRKRIIPLWWEVEPDKFKEKAEKRARWFQHQCLMRQLAYNFVFVNEMPTSVKFCPQAFLEGYKFDRLYAEKSLHEILVPKMESRQRKRRVNQRVFMLTSRFKMAQLIADKAMERPRCCLVLDIPMCVYREILKLL